ncbi:hypothetical protein N7U66_04325 [Lacinutrix neustonica]|uniref:Uncharacterized protein n=1 Tax=Lacinutrix neustonica TaxID=2980107 RepID=A0A9E8MXK4_9FLAO|nr:hypothetical protein [Lacinutrix neustonica]WAC02866.1 hypothetical protein N7U66_04325 [Lacinutrix neustonica]
MTAPVLVENEDDPCDILNGLINDTKVINAINNLKAKTQGIREYGYEIEYKYDSNAEAYAYDPILKTSGNELSVSLAIGGYIQGHAHNHPKAALSLPSWGGY